MRRVEGKDNFFIRYGINNNTYHLLFRDYDNLLKEEQSSEKEIEANVTIDYFTKL